MTKQLFLIVMTLICVQESCQKDAKVTFETHCTYNGTEKPIPPKRNPSPMEPKPQIKLHVFADHHLLKGTFKGDEKEMEYYLDDVVEGARKLVDGLGLDLYWFRFNVVQFWDNHHDLPPKINFPDKRRFLRIASEAREDKPYDIAIHVSGYYTIKLDNDKERMRNYPEVGNGGTFHAIGIIAVHQQDKPEHLSSAKDIAFQLAHNVAHVFGVYQHDDNVTDCDCGGKVYEQLRNNQYCMMHRLFSRDLDAPNWSNCSKKYVVDFFGGDRMWYQWTVNNRTNEPRIRFPRPDDRRPTSNKTTTIIIILAVVGVILLLIIIVVIAYLKKKKPNPTVIAYQGTAIDSDARSAYQTPALK